MKERQAGLPPYSAVTHASYHNEEHVPVSIARRTLLVAPLLSLPAFAEDTVSLLRQLEQQKGGRLGVAMLDTASGRRAAYRGDEPFPMCSTFKFLAAALMLVRVDRGEENLDRRIVFAASDLVPYSPATKDHAGPGGMTVDAICEAAMTLSDNTAGNLMLASFGGPAGLTAFVRTLGDPVTRLDRIETHLNEGTPGDPRDTTSPLAMLGAMQKLVAGNVLSVGSRKRLIGWLVANKTGDKRLRAGLPAAWRIGDKTGTGGNGSANDIAVAWPTGRAPVFIAAYYTGSTISDEARSAVISEVGRIATAGLA